MRHHKEPAAAFILLSVCFMVMISKTTATNHIAVSIPNTLSFPESAVFPRVCALLSGPGVSGGSSTTVPIVVDFATSGANGSTASAGVDYESDFLSRTFVVGSTDAVMSRCISINLYDDTIFEGEEFFLVELAIQTPMDILLGNPTTFVFLEEDEVATVEIPTISNITEQDGVLQFCATLQLVGTSTSIPINIQLNTRDASAIAGSDYASLVATLEFPVPSFDGSIQCTTVTIFDDILLEGDETFSMQLTVLTPDATQGNNVTTIILEDDEYLDFRAYLFPIYSFFMGVDSLLLCVTLSGDSTLEFNVSLTLHFAQRGLYNRAVVEVYRELIIPIGLDNGDSVCTEVENTNDTQFIMRLAKTDNDTRYALGNTIGAVIFNCTETEPYSIALEDIAEPVPQNLHAAVSASPIVEFISNVSAVHNEFNSCHTISVTCMLLALHTTIALLCLY